METLVSSPLKGAELMKACLVIEPDLNTALDLMIQITLERKFRETSKMTFHSLEHLDKHIQSLGLKDPVAFRERVLSTDLKVSSMPPPLPHHSGWRKRLAALLCCSKVCRSTPPTEQK